MSLKSVLKARLPSQLSRPSKPSVKFWFQFFGRSQFAVVTPYHRPATADLAFINNTSFCHDTLQGKFLRSSELGISVSACNLSSCDVSPHYCCAKVVAMKVHLATIARAIRIGAPVFNDGDTLCCSEVYEHTIARLLASPSLPDVCAKDLRTSLAASMKQGTYADETKRAWALRMALDRAAAELKLAAARRGVMVADFRHAIRTGVPLWNDGHVVECTELYHAAVSKHAGASPALAAALKRARTAPVDARASSRGFVLRNAMDAELRRKPAAASVPRAHVVDRLGVAIDRGVPRWNAGDRRGCVSVYLGAALAYADAEPALQLAVDASSLAPCDGSSNSQGFVLRRAFDKLSSDAVSMAPRKSPVPRSPPPPPAPTAPAAAPRADARGTAPPPAVPSVAGAASAHLYTAFAAEPGAAGTRQHRVATPEDVDNTFSTADLSAAISDAADDDAGEGCGMATMPSSMATADTADIMGFAGNAMKGIRSAALSSSSGGAGGAGAGAGASASTLDQADGVGLHGYDTSQGIEEPPAATASAGIDDVIGWLPTIEFGELEDMSAAPVASGGFGDVRHPRLPCYDKSLLVVVCSCH